MCTLVGVTLLKVGGAGAPGAEGRVVASVTKLGGDIPNKLWAITRKVYFFPGNKSETSCLLQKKHIHQLLQFAGLNPTHTNLKQKSKK